MQVLKGEKKTWLMMCTGLPQRFGHKSESHICHPTCLCFSSSFNYIFIFVVVEWCVEPRSATDPSPDPTEIEHPAYPTINNPPLFSLFPPTLHPSLRGLCKYFSSDFTSLSWSGIVLFLPQFCWRQDDRLKTGKQLKKTCTNMHVRGRKIKRK